MLPFRKVLLLYLIVAFLMLPSYPLAQTIPTDELGFTRLVAEKMKNEVSDAPVTTKSPLTLSVGGLQANLDRIYLFCKSNSSACQAEIENYVKGVAGVLKDPNSPVARDAVGIVIRTAEYIKQVQELLGRGGHVIPTYPIVEGLIAMPVIDTPRAVRPIDERDLKALNISREQLFDLAMANLHLPGVDGACAALFWVV